MRRGYTLVELVVSIVAAAGLFAGLAAALSLAAAAVDDAAVGPAADRDAMRAASMIALDARHATLIDAGPDRLGLAVDDRFGGAGQAVVEYTWDGTAGGTLSLAEGGEISPITGRGVDGFEAAVRERLVPGVGFSRHLTSRFSMNHRFFPLGVNPLPFSVPGLPDYEAIGLFVVDGDDRFQDPAILSSALQPGHAVRLATTRRILITGPETDGETPLELGLDTTGDWSVAYAVWRDDELEDSDVLAAGFITGTAGSNGVPTPSLSALNFWNDFEGFEAEEDD